MIQVPHAGDLLVCLLSHNIPLHNVARTKDSLFNSQSSAPFITVLKQLAFPEGNRHVLICVESNRLRAVLSSRSRSGVTAWEIDQFLVTEDDESLGASMLENLGPYSGQKGAHKIFLRIEKDDPMVDAARRAGFFIRGTEYLYCIERPDGRDLPNIPTNALRAKTGSDEYHVFQLYNAVTPPALRHAEGMTLQEWRASRDKNRRVEVLYQEEDRVVGWLQLSVTKGAGVFELMAMPSKEKVEEILTEYGLSKLSRTSMACCIVQEHQVNLRRLFMQKGFHLTGEYVVLLKQLAVTVPQPSLAPLQV